MASIRVKGEGAGAMHQLRGILRTEPVITNHRPEQLTVFDIHDQGRTMGAFACLPATCDEGCEDEDGGQGLSCPRCG